MIDRTSLKSSAAELCKTASPSLILVGLIYALLTIVMSTLSSKVMSAGITVSDANRFLNAFYNGNYDVAFALMDRVRPSGTSYLVDWALRLVMMIISAGFTIFVLKVSLSRRMDSLC